jgi:hypothetical protein
MVSSYQSARDADTYRRAIPTPLDVYVLDRLSLVGLTDLRERRSCPKRWCKNGGHGLNSTLARAAAQAAAMRRGLALGSSLKASSVSRLL